MKFNIIKPKSSDLKSSIDYFLFIKSNDGQIADAYTTIPNTNVCLSIYKNNEVYWNREENTCHLIESAQFGASKIYGWHQQPFKVRLFGQSDQVCVVFKPTGLANFTNIPLNKIEVQDDPLTELFRASAKRIRQQIFNTACNEKRARLLEAFLLAHLNPRPEGIIDLFIQYLTSSTSVGPFSIHKFCKKQKVNESTLYRHFTAYVGESAKKFEQKHRLRAFLQQLGTPTTLTSLSYALNYADQSHFIREIKQYTGNSPRQLAARLSKVEDELFLMV